MNYRLVFFCPKSSDLQTGLRFMAILVLWGKHFWYIDFLWLIKSDLYPGTATCLSTNDDVNQADVVLNKISQKDRHNSLFFWSDAETLIQQVLASQFRTLINLCGSLMRTTLINFVEFSPKLHCNYEVIRKNNLILQSYSSDLIIYPPVISDSVRDENMLSCSTTCLLVITGWRVKHQAYSTEGLIRLTIFQKKDVKGALYDAIKQ